MKLHLGCWKRFIPGFIHIDLCDMKHIDYKSDIGNLKFIDNETVDYIYSSHALEYKNFDECKLVLKEWFRVLKTGGMLRIAVPDFEKLIELYNSTRDIDKIIGPLYGQMNLNEIKIYHRCVFDKKKLVNLLSEIGFSSISRYDWRNTEHANIDDHSQAYFPHMDKENGLLLSLNIEAHKL